MLLKDIEVTRNNSVVTQEDTFFCDPDPGPGQPARKGWCPGIKGDPQQGSPDQTGGKWIFTVNGQVYPSMDVRGEGEIWRLLNASGSRGYSLSLRDDETGTLLPFQLLSIDGIAIDAAPGTNVAALAERFGGRIHPVACAGSGRSKHETEPVCATTLRMMPSSRMEIWVPSRPSRSREATLITDSLITGPDGDAWPSAELAHLSFAGHGPRGPERDTLEVKRLGPDILKPTGVLGNAARISVPGMLDSVPFENRQENA